MVVALTSDAEVKSKKGYTPELNFAERKEILEAVKYVTEVVESPWLITEDFVNEHHCDLLVHGLDNVNPIDPKRLVIFLRTEGVSSSTLRERVLDCLIEMKVGVGIRKARALHDRGHQKRISPGIVPWFECSKSDF